MLVDLNFLETIVRRLFGSTFSWPIFETFCLAFSAFLVSTGFVISLKSKSSLPEVIRSYQSLNKTSCANNVTQNFLIGNIESKADFWFWGQPTGLAARLWPWVVQSLAFALKHWTCPVFISHCRENRYDCFSALSLIFQTSSKFTQTLELNSIFEFSNFENKLNCKSSDVNLTRPHTKTSILFVYYRAYKLMENLI